MYASYYQNYVKYDILKYLLDAWAGFWSTGEVDGKDVGAGGILSKDSWVSWGAGWKSIVLLFLENCLLQKLSEILKRPLSKKAQSELNWRNTNWSGLRSGATIVVNLNSYNLAKRVAATTAPFEKAELVSKVGLLLLNFV